MSWVKYGIVCVLEKDKTMGSRFFDTLDEAKEYCDMCKVVFPHKKFRIQRTVSHCPGHGWCENICDEESKGEKQ